MACYPNSLCFEGDERGGGTSAFLRREAASSGCKVALSQLSLETFSSNHHHCLMSYIGAFSRETPSCDNRSFDSHVGL